MGSVDSRRCLPRPIGPRTRSSSQIISSSVSWLDHPFEANAVDPGEECELAAVRLFGEDRDGSACAIAPRSDPA